MLITGAAKRIGAALAAHYAARGWNLVLHYHRSAREADQLAVALTRDHGVQVQLVQADLADTSALTHFWRDVPACSALIHSAAMFERDRLASMQSATLQQQMQVNFLSPLQLTQGFMAQLPTEQSGNVIVLGDGAMGWSISPEFFSYALSKQAWRGALDVLAAACAPRTRVNLIALAPTLPGENDAAELFARLATHVPLQRTGTPQEVCSAVDYLLAAEGVTGQILSLAGGAELFSARPTIDA